MTLLTTCSACQMGDHKHHQRVVQSVPEGMMGGMVCDCKGECRDGRYKRSLDQLLGLPEGAMKRVFERGRR